MMPIWVSQIVNYNNDNNIGLEGSYFMSMVVLWRPLYLVTYCFMRRTLRILNFEYESGYGSVAKKLPWFIKHLSDGLLPLYILFKFVKFLIRHLGLAIGNVRHVHDVHAKGQSQRSKVKVIKVKTQFSCFQTVTLVWIHIWWQNDVQGLMWHRSCVLLFFKVICQITRSHRTKHSQFWPNLGISGL